MPDYRYVCVTLKGEYLRGEFTAGDKNGLAWNLWNNHLFLIWWEEIQSVSSDSLPLTQIDPVLIPREEIGDLWKEIWGKERPPMVGLMPIDRRGGGSLRLRVYRNLSSSRKSLIYTLLILVALPLTLESPVKHLLEVMKWRRQFHAVQDDMQHIADAAKAEASQGRYAPQAMPGVSPPSLEKFLQKWPTPPCAGWVYGWDNWTNVPGMDNTVRVTLRDSHLYAVFYQCVSSSGDCSPGIMWGHGTPIDQAKNGYVTCHEQ